MSGSGFNNSGWNFSTVQATSSGGHDTGLLYGSTGNDQLEADSTHATLYGTGYNNRIDGYEKTHVHSYGGGKYSALVDNAFIEKGLTNEPIGSGAVYSKGLWLYDLESLYVTQKPSNNTPTQTAIDKIMSMYWP